MQLRVVTILLFSMLTVNEIRACSVVYYVDKNTGKILVANNEDYWYDVKAYIQIVPNAKNQFARLWYGWDGFAQGGINEAGLFFDGATTPQQSIPPGYGKPKGNLGDELLAHCRTVEDALAYLEKEKVALASAHMMLGDRTGKAVVVEWINSERKLTWIRDNQLIMTNFLLADTSQGNYPCTRFHSIERNMETLQKSKEEASLLKVGNVLGQAVQLPQANESNQVGGTLYSSFIDITDMQFALVYKLDNAKITKLDLRKEFETKRKRKIKLG